MKYYSKSLDILMKSPVTDEMIQYLTKVTLKVLPNNKYNNTVSQHHYPSPPSSPNELKTFQQQQRLPSLRTFITRLVRYTNVYTQTLLTTACYLNKLKRILPRDAKGLPSTVHRLFLACLILSAKFHNDSSPLNKHWAKYTDGLFSCDDINLMERQLLNLLNWDLRVTEDDLILDLQFLLEPIREHIMKTEIQIKKRTQRQALQQQQQQHKVYQATRVPISTTPVHYNNISIYSSNNKLHERDCSIASNMSSATLVSSSRSSSRCGSEIDLNKRIITPIPCKLVPDNNMTYSTSTPYIQHL
ncbi:cyclin family protein PWA37_002943 [Arxiozyma heterogenica]|uniref:cyclin family protein n=1 Tax=Arxiozyma heterogenica TaxID=278026 RepID=UPI002F209A52